MAYAVQTITRVTPPGATRCRETDPLMATAQTRPFAVVADVGGTHVRLGVLPDADAPLAFIEDYRCAQFAQLAEVLHQYQAQLAELGVSGAPQLLCLALPGDVQSHPIHLVNLNWQVDTRQLARQFGCRVVTLNDFSAQAHAIPAFSNQDLDWLRSPADELTGLNRAIIGPGTGLGVSGLLPGGEVVESEGGHLSFAPQTPLQQQLLSALWTVFPRLSVERLISGPGLANLYRGLGLIHGQDHQLQPEQITEQARAGDPLCRQAVELFTEIFGSVCGDLALTLGAKGGVYLSGGLLQGLDDLFDPAPFIARFDDKGRYRDYCRQIPLARVRAPQPGLLGATRFARSLAGQHD